VNISFKILSLLREKLQLKYFLKELHPGVKTHLRID